MRNISLIGTPAAALFLLSACAHSEPSLLREYELLAQASAVGDRRPVVAEGEPIPDPTTAHVFIAAAEPRPKKSAPVVVDRFDDDDLISDDSIVDAFGKPTLAVNVAGRGSCVVKLGRHRLGQAPLEVEVPEGRYRVVVKCGRRQLFARRLLFVAGEEHRLNLETSKQQKKKKQRRRRRS